jgi:adenylate cyclase
MNEYSSRLAVILHADVASSTALVQRDELAAHRAMREVFTLLSEKVEEAGGRVEEIRGDALVALFDRASDATTAALAFQAERSEPRSGEGGALRPRVRIGIALGEVVVADSTITGAGVVLAQRLEQLAEPGSVCISAAVREALPGRLNFDYRDLGEQRLKGFDEHQRAYRLQPGVQPAVTAAQPHAGGEAAAPASSRPRRASIAVLPFVSLGTDPGDELFADGMTEDLTTALSKFKELTVIARGTTFSLKGQHVDVVSLGEKLGVRYLVQGSLRRAGQRIRVTAQLTDTADGAQIWAERFDRNLEDVFAVQDELTEAITVAVAPQIERTERALARLAHPDSLDAWALLQDGLSRMMEDTPESLAQAELSMRRACALDPGYAAAFAWAAFNRSQRIWFGATADASLSVDEALQWAEQAIALDKDDPVCHMALGRALIATGRYERALLALDRAVELNPNFAIAQIFLGVARLMNGEPELALRHADTAARLCPRDGWAGRAYLNKMAALRTLHRYEESVEAGERACHLAPSLIMAHAYLAVSYALAGRIEAGRAAWRRALALDPDLTPASVIGRRGVASPAVMEPLALGFERLGLST